MAGHPFGAALPRLGHPIFELHTSHQVHAFFSAARIGTIGNHNLHQIPLASDLHNLSVCHLLLSFEGQNSCSVCEGGPGRKNWRWPSLSQTSNFPNSLCSLPPGRLWSAPVFPSRRANKTLPRPANGTCSSPLPARKKGEFGQLGISVQLGNARNRGRKSVGGGPPPPGVPCPVQGGGSEREGN